MSHIHVEPIACLKDNYAWVVRCGATGATALVDACVPSVLDSFEPGCHLEAVWSTHHHWDHVGGNLAVVQAFPGLEVFGHESDRSRIPGLTVGLKDGEHMSLGHLAVEVMHVPGHTLGAIAYVVRSKDEVAVFTGDTMFSAGCGRLFEGTPAMMFESLSRLGRLPEKTRVYCGHEYTASNLAFAHHLEPGSPAIAQRAAEVATLRESTWPSLPSTIATELATNPFLRCDAPELQATLGFDGRDGVDPVEVFTAARKLKDGFKG